jgi:hypothetical protein
MPTIVDKVCIDFIIQHCCNNTKHDEVTTAWFQLPHELVQTMTRLMEQLSHVNTHFIQIAQERERDHNMGVGSDYQEHRYDMLKKASYDQTHSIRVVLFQLYHYMVKKQLLV